MIDLARVMRFSRLDAIFQADIVFVHQGDRYLIAKHKTERPEVKIPREFYVESIDIQDGLIVLTIVPTDREKKVIYDGKDKIKWGK